MHLTFTALSLVIFSGTRFTPPSEIFTIGIHLKTTVDWECAVAAMIRMKSVMINIFICFSYDDITSHYAGLFII